MKVEGKVVIDCSFTMPLFFGDEDAKQSEELMDLAFDKRIQLYVPSLWSYEIYNVVLTAIRRRRIDRVDGQEIITIIRNLPVLQSHFTPDQYKEVFNVAALYHLSFYDGAYLYLALSQGAKIATLDKRLIDAAEKCGVRLV